MAGRLDQRQHHHRCPPPRYPHLHPHHPHRRLLHRQVPAEVEAEVRLQSAVLHFAFLMPLPSQLSLDEELVAVEAASFVKSNAGWKIHECKDN